MAHGNKSWYPIGSDNEAHVQPKVGIGNTASYQSSGVPATGRLAPGQTVTFTKVTKAVTVFTAGNVPFLVDFGNGMPVTLPIRDAFRFEIKTTTITNPHLTVTFEFVAELTGIDAGNCPNWDNTNGEWFSIA